MDVAATNYTYQTTHNTANTFIFLILVSMAMVFSNALIIATYIKAKIPHTITNTIILHLVITDFTLGFVVTITSILRSVIDLMDISDECDYLICILNVGSFLCLASISMLFAAFANFDRFMAICKSESYNAVVTPRMVNIATTLFWIIPTMVCTIAMSFQMTDPKAKLAFCGYEYVFHSCFYSSTTFVMTFIMLTSLSFYICILKTAREFYSRIHSTRLEDNIDSNNRDKRIRRAIRNGNVIGALTVVLILCWAPFCIMSICTGFGIKGIDVQVKGAILILATLNGIFNPFIYAWQRPDIRQGALKIICFCRRNSVREVKEMNILRSRENTDNVRGSNAVDGKILQGGITITTKVDDIQVTGIRRIVVEECIERVDNVS